jgi:hypothetical protein
MSSFESSLKNNLFLDEKNLLLPYSNAKRCILRVMTLKFGVMTLSFGVITLTLGVLTLNKGVLTLIIRVLTLKKGV